MTTRAPLRVGVIGAGVFAGLHAGKIAANPDAVLAGLYDIDGPRTQALAGTHGAPEFASLAELLAACDAVVVASAAVAHEEQAGAALAAGRHAYVEKPLATSGAGARALATAAAAGGLVLQVGHQERIVALATSGAIRSPEIQLYPLSDAAAAHRISEGRHFSGQLVCKGR